MTPEDDGESAPGVPMAPGVPTGVATLPGVAAPSSLPTLSGRPTSKIVIAPLSARDTEVAPPLRSSPPRLVDAEVEPLIGIDDASRYEIAGLLGEGGMGEVRLCRDRRIGREVAMKIAKGSEGSHPDLVARFLREVRVQGQLEHPGVVPVYDLGADARGRTLFTMKRVRGRTLEDLIERLARGDAATVARFSRRALLAAFSRACLTVAFAHSRGVVHRDLKPANVMLGDFGEVYVLDWGIAKLVADAPERVEASGASPDPSPPSSREATPLLDDPSIGRTQAGVLLGTPGYMAPEQARGDLDELGPPADIYALGCILFELLALAPLHPGTRAADLLISTLRGADARPSLRLGAETLPPELDAICVRATALAAADRFGSARELAEAIDGYLDGERDVERRRELGADHVRAAQEGLAAGTAESQRAAVRALGQALALDPTNQEALAALRTVVLDPQNQLPPEAERELERIGHQDRARAAVRIGVVVLSFPFAAPILLWMGVRDVTLFAVLLAMALAQAGYALFMGLTDRADPRFMRYFIGPAFLVNGAIAALFGPYVLAPVLSVLTAATLLVSLRPNALTRRFILGASLVGVAGPALLDGLLYRSTVFEEGQIRILPVLAEFPELATRVVLLLANVGMVVAVNYLVGKAAGRIVDLERRNFGQAWRLRHLLPEGIAAPPASRPRPRGAAAIASEAREGGPLRDNRPCGSPADPTASARGSAPRPKA